MTRIIGSEVQTLPKNLREAYHDLILSISFSLIFPIGSVENTERRLSGAIWAIPVISTVIAIISLLVAWLAWEVFTIWYLTIIIIIVFNMIVTGCLHEDGLADVMDAFGVVNHEGAFSKRLAVMKDPNLGTYGVMSLIVLFFSRFLSMSQLDWESLVVATIIVLPLSKMVFPLLLRFAPPARESGLAYMAGKPSLGVLFLSIVLTCWPAIIFIPKIEHVILLVAIVLVVFVVLRYATLRLIGGLSGDVCGAASVICELLLWWAIVFVNNNSILNYKDLIWG